MLLRIAVLLASISSRCRALREAKRWAGVFPSLPAISAFASRKVSMEAPQSSQVTESSSDAGKLKRLLPQLRHDRLAFFQTIPSLARHVRHGYGLSGRTSTNTAQMSALGSLAERREFFSGVAKPSGRFRDRALARRMTGRGVGSRMSKSACVSSQTWCYSASSSRRVRPCVSRPNHAINPADITVGTNNVSAAPTSVGAKPASAAI